MIGVVTADGVAIAFSVDDLRSRLVFGETLEYEGVEITPMGGGFAASLADGTQLAAHQAFWFAWSQFHPDTLLWPPG